MATALPYSEVFNKHRYVALLLFIIAACVVWYGIVLMTNPFDSPPVPDRNQWIGLIIAIFVAAITWLGRAFTIIPDKK